MMKLYLLPLPHEAADDAQAVKDWACGLDWVRWLLSSVRARTEMLMVEHGSWEDFADGLLCEAVGPALKNAWLAAEAGDLAQLVATDAELSSRLSAGQNARSIRAGAVLLKSTRHARYQAVLGRLREAVGQGDCVGHFAVVWAVVAHFFQLSLANVVAEYLHLEWAILARDDGHRERPVGRHSIAGLTSQIMRTVMDGAVPRLVDAALMRQTSRTRESECRTSTSKS